MEEKNISCNYLNDSNSKKGGSPIIANKAVIVTGGAGFIGSNLVHALAKPELDNHIVVIDNLSTGHLKNIKELLNTNKNIEAGSSLITNNFLEEQNKKVAIKQLDCLPDGATIESDYVTFINVDITNLALLQNIFQKYKPQFVFHQAAIPSVPRSVKDPVKSNNANVNGTLNVLVAARDANVKKIVYASSSSVYGDTPTLPKKEDMKPCPLSPYAVSKLAGEYYCKVFTECYDLPTVALRYFNVYGPRQDPNSEYAAVIPKFITSALNNKPPTIYGDGKQTRDFTFVKDVVNANILATENETTTGIFNVASGKRITINNLAESILDIRDVQINPIYDDPRPGDILHSLADVSKADDKFGWKPKYGIDDSLKKTCEWLSKKIQTAVI